MDFKKLASEVIDAVKHATRKFDEEYAGEVMAERLSDALTQAGFDWDAKPDLDGAWYGIPDDALMSLVLAFVDNPSMSADDDAAITRIKSDIYEGLQWNIHLETNQPAFWKSVHDRL
jgi:hypothetical protein